MIETSSRHPDHEIESFFLERWSPRAFDGSTLPHADLFRMFEAARWSPSSYNSQPWRFLYSIREDANWERFLGLLGDFNRSWADRAGALVVVVSNSMMTPPGRTDEIPSHSHSFDAGSAWAALAFQALHLGYHTHGMVGFDIDRAFAELGVPPGFRVEMMLAIGRKGDPSVLPEAVRARETPNDRRPVSAFAFEGRFPPDA